MAATYTLGFATILILSIILVSYADPGHVHTKHVIHAPLHIKMIHHHKIIKVPVVFRKHLHHHKHLSQEHVYIPLKEKPKPVYEEVVGGADGGAGGDDYPSRFVKGHKPVVEYSSDEGDSDEDLGGGSQGHYKSHIGGGGGFSSGGGYSSGSDKSEDSSYEYDESQDTGAYSNYRYHGMH